MHLAGPLAHVPAWGATASGPPSAEQSCCPLSSAKIVLPGEGAPSSLQVALPGCLCHTRGPGTGAVAAEAPHCPEQGQEPLMASLYSLARCKRWRKSPAWKIETNALVLKASPSPTVPSASQQPNLQVPGVWSSALRSSASVSSDLIVSFTLGMCGWA